MNASGPNEADRPESRDQIVFGYLQASMVSNISAANQGVSDDD